MADNRKQWLTECDPGSFVDHNIKRLSYRDFIHKELIHFSNADCLRSIPSVLDGLKPGQRKILFAGQFEAECWNILIEFLPPPFPLRGPRTPFFR